MGAYSRVALIQGKDLGKLFNNPVSRVRAYSRVSAYSRDALNRSITVLVLDLRRKLTTLFT